MFKSICIERQFGSGGRAIGKILSQTLGYAFFDSKLVDMAAGINHDLAAKEDEEFVNPWRYIPGSFGVTPEAFGHTGPEQMFHRQERIIREEAEKQNCIFVGRCAAQALENSDAEKISLFIYAPVDWRIDRLIKTEGYYDEKEAYSRMRKKDRDRYNYFKYHTGQIYNDPTNYDLCVNSSVLGINGSAKFLVDYINFR